MLNTLTKLGLFIYFRGLFIGFLQLFKQYWRNTVSGLVSASICIYLHEEYLAWVQLTGDQSNLTLSFLIKNAILLLLAFKYIYLPIKKSPTLELTEPTNAKTTPEQIQSNPDKLEKVFNKLREKNNLKTKADQILERQEGD